MTQLMETAKKLVPGINLLYYAGISKGASIGAMLAAEYQCIKGLMLINPPLMVNWVKIKNGLEKFAGDKAVVFLGEQDPSFRYREILRCVNLQNLELVEMQGKGHRVDSEVLKQVADTFLRGIRLV